MSHSYAQNHIHLVFSTKDREKLIAKPLQRKLWAHMADICKHYDMLGFAKSVEYDPKWYLADVGVAPLALEDPKACQPTACAGGLGCYALRAGTTRGSRAARPSTTCIGRRYCRGIWSCADFRLSLKNGYCQSVFPA